MKRPAFCTAGDSAALRHARQQLEAWGYVVSATPSAEATHLLLPVPSLENDGTIKGGGSLAEVLLALPRDVTVLGGNLPELPCRSIDFLRDEFYLSENAAITAQCTLNLLRPPVLDAAVLLIGYGRIGKHLAPLLKVLGANVTIATRKRVVPQPDYQWIETGAWNAAEYDIIINTAPAPLLAQQDTRYDAQLIDLASAKGISGDRVIWARGLPNREAPDASGILIAKTALRYALGKE